MVEEEEVVETVKAPVHPVQLEAQEEQVAQEEESW